MQTRDKVKGLHNCWEFSRPLKSLNLSYIEVKIFQIYSVWIHRIAKPKKAKIFVFLFVFLRLIKMCFVLYCLASSVITFVWFYLFWPLFDFLKEATHFKSKFLCVVVVHTMKVVFRLDQPKWNTLYLCMYSIHTWCDLLFR